MAEWQHQRPNVPHDQGYHQNLPNRSATERNATGYLEDQDGQKFYLWIHQIEAAFQQGGAFAQSVFKRDWHGRNFAQPSFVIRGQFANQSEYARFAEFVRVTQDKSLRWQNQGRLFNTAKLVIYGGADLHKQRTPYVLYGHVQRCARATTRFINAPEFQLEFLVSLSYDGLFRQTKATTFRRLQKWTDVFNENNVVADPTEFTLERPPNAPGFEGGSTAGGDTSRPT